MFAQLILFILFVAAILGMPGRNGEVLAKSVQGVLQLESGSVTRLKEILR